MSVQRYAPDFNGKMLPAEDGRWVRFDDYSEARAPLDVERFGDAVMAALRLRLIHGATDATYTPREVAEMVGRVIEKRVAALEEPGS
jgi:hypothetical protein